MDTALTSTPHTGAELGPLIPLAEAARDYIRQSKADNTRKAYRADWKRFALWCVEHGKESLPATAETVALYLTDLAEGHKPSTLTRHSVSIGQAHQAAGYDSPTATITIRTLLSGIRRAKGTAPTQKTPTLTDDIRRMVELLPDKLLGLRDRALLLIGFAGGFRRSELVGLDRSDCQFTGDGLVITLRRSKTDQEGEGRKIGIPFGSHPETCPVRALQAWIEASDQGGPAVFLPLVHGKIGAARLSDKAVARMVKGYVSQLGHDAKSYAGHSLRAGLATAAAISGASEKSIMAQTGHKSSKMVRRYIRDGSLFRENAAASLGL